MADTAVPTSGLKVDPTTGAVTYDFDGYVHAEGLDLDSSALNAPTSLITWNRTSDDVNVASIGGGDSQGGLVIQSRDPDGVFPGPVARLVLISRTAGRHQSVLVACGINGATNRVILTEEGHSGFLQLANDASDLLELAQGAGQWIWNGTNASNVTTVTHDIGRVPQCVLITASDDIGQLEVPIVIGRNTTQFTTRARAAGAVGSGGVSNFNWLAIG